jgi:hypothetical protein
MHRRTFLVSAVSLILAACVPTPSRAARSSASPEPALLARPDRNIWPLQYRQAPAAVQTAYAFAAAHHDVLTYIPCFCGCGAQGHRNNYDCFVRSQGTGGAVILDPHGFACGTCVGVALQSKALLEQGLSAKAIRHAIDTSWSNVGPSTDTAFPD